MQECRLNRSSNTDLFQTRIEKALSHNQCLSRNKFSKKPNFIISHYAGKVCYQLAAMVEKNKVSVSWKSRFKKEITRNPTDQKLFKHIYSVMFTGHTLIQISPSGYVKTGGVLGLTYGAASLAQADVLLADLSAEEEVEHVSPNQGFCHSWDKAEALMASGHLYPWMQCFVSAPPKFR